MLLVGYSTGPLDLSFGRLGLTNVRPLEVVLSVCAGALLTAPLFLAARRGKAFVADERVKGLKGGRLAYQILVRVPAGTALWEETAFRGVLFALWSDQGVVEAAIASAVVFGLWHVSPTLVAVRLNRSGASPLTTARVVAAAVVVTAVAGCGLALLRQWTGSLYVPIALHATVNSLATTAGVVAHRRRSVGESG